MKNIILKFSSALALVALLFNTSCDETTYVDSTITMAPEIISFTPTEGLVGCEIYITGESLHNVLTAKIGDNEVTILERVSDTQLTILADIEGESGPITLINSNGETTSSESFTYSYAAPQLSADNQVNIEMGEKMLIMGENLSSITAVYFTPKDGNPDSDLYLAAISLKESTEVLVTVPYVSSDDATLVLEYKDGSKSVQINTGHDVVIQRDKPEIATFTETEVTVGRTVTLTGTFMNKISWIMLGGKQASISVQTSDTLSFTVPTNEEYSDGDNVNQTLEVVYFDGYESVVLTSSLTVYVPFVHYWQDILTYAQSREAAALSCFFAPEQGVVWANSDWQSLDVTSVAKSGAVSGGTIGTTTSNIPTTEEDEYNAVPPYFFFSVENGGALAIYSPNNSNSQLKNYYGTTSSDSSVTGGASWYGTPSLGFRWIDPAASVAAEVDLYNAVVNGTLEDISPATLPIDTANSLIGDVSISSTPSGALKDTSWANGVFSAYYPTGASGYTNFSYPCDVVIMVLYYAHDRVDTTTGSAKALDKVKRIGFVHITNVEYIYDSNGYAKASSFLYNCYWQKYDYDHTAL